MIVVVVIVVIRDGGWGCGVRECGLGVVWREEARWWALNLVSHMTITILSISHSHGTCVLLL
jgi:hypothetical protein